MSKKSNSSKKKSASLSGFKPVKPVKFKPTAENRSELFELEYLQTNSLGAFSSGTFAGCNTRRYHSLLVGTTNPPVERVSAISTIMEQVIVEGETINLATNEFEGSFSPAGFELLSKIESSHKTVFTWKVGKAKLTKEILLHDSQNAVAVRYTVRGKFDKLLLRPFCQIRDFHSLRRADNSAGFAITASQENFALEDPASQYPAVHCAAPGATFNNDPQWWYDVRYRIEAARGQDCIEDIYSPGYFELNSSQGKTVTIFASLGDAEIFDFDQLDAKRNAHVQSLADSIGIKDKAARRLAAFSDQFVVQRTVDGKKSTTILAGYPWFADWGRDTFIALPGLLLTTKQYDKAREVFTTFAEHISQGMVPNRFDDYNGPAHYNSMDASLWFISAAELFMRETNDQAFWESTLAKACETIVAHYTAGTRFGIKADSDALLVGGSDETQLTWMDAKIAGEVFTSRHGKAVEINALWYNAHRILETRSAGLENSAEFYREKADKISAAFERVFWNQTWGWCNDCVKAGVEDASLRPNQIFAVSLPFSPLCLEKQRKVVYAIRDSLLCPAGLRTLSPQDSRYQGTYAGAPIDRERAYHQGTAWAWLIGPFIQAWLNVEGAGKNRTALKQAKRWTGWLDEHLKTACVNSISEIFDGDYPHHPRGCYAQAWSVAQVLWAKLQIAKLDKK